MLLTNHLASNHITHKFQSAYRAGHSTKTTLFCTVSDILITASEASRVSILILLDSSAAFHTTDILEKNTSITGDGRSYCDLQG